MRARAIAKTPNSVSAPSPKFQRVRWVDSIEAVTGIIERDSHEVPARGGQVFHDSSGCKANGEMYSALVVGEAALSTCHSRGVLRLGIGRGISRHNEAPPTYSRAAAGVDLASANQTGIKSRGRGRDHEAAIGRNCRYHWYRFGHRVRDVCGRTGIRDQDRF
jgi:hypothetical protein